MLNQQIFPSSTETMVVLKQICEAVNIYISAGSTETMVVLKHRLKIYFGKGTLEFHRNNGCIETLFRAWAGSEKEVPPKQWLY